MADERAPDTGEGAEQKPKKPKQAGSLAWLWMLLALISVGGFLAWLGMEAEPTSISVVEEEEAMILDPPSVTVVSKDTLAENKGDYVAQEIRVHNVAITGTLGEKIYWGELGDQTTQIPILVRLDSAAAAGDSISGPFTPQTGAFYSIRGLVFPMSDSLAMAWGEQGEFAGEGEQTQAMFTDYYIQVDDIQPTPESLQESTATAQDTASADSAAMGEEREGAMSGDAGTSG
jgi:hypothetical protein